MLFPDLNLARRLELHEAWSSAAHARAQAHHYPETGATSLPVAGGYAVFCGHRSPNSGVYGVGMTGAVDADDADAMEVFYEQRALPTRVRVCPLADPSLLHLLAERGYDVQDFMNVYILPIETDDSAPATPSGLDIRVATTDETRDWFRRSGAGGDWAEPDGVAFMTVRCALKDGARLFLAWRDGEPAGGGGLEVHAGVAALMAADTLPAFRNQGVHTALLRARLAEAAEDGCDVAMIHTRPGAPSQRNVLRAGFQLAYTTVGMTGPARKGD